MDNDFPAEPSAEAARRSRGRFFFRTLRNPVGLVGVVLLGTSIVTFLFFLLIEIIAGEVGPYVGIFHLLVLPPVALLGLGLAFVGHWWEKRRRRRAEDAGAAWEPLDIGETRVQQRLLLTAGVLSAGLVFVTAVGGYRAYEFTDSTEFCGEVCHTVMKPEYTAYQSSPHARVACADCHVGPGAGWYVRSKLSGLYQVWATVQDIYPRPIPTPIESLRPAQETCEQCHWPRYFFGSRRQVFTHYLTDGSEEPWEIDMLLNIGGGDPQRGYTHGIHWHMNIANRIEYIARDEQRLDIPWVRVTDELGNVTVYRDVENPPSEELLAEGEIRLMDCMDCHNRPSHIFDSPVEAVNRELELGNLDPAMPDIKLLAVELLAEEYPSQQEADLAITQGLRNAYAEDFSDFYDGHQRQVEEAAVVLRRVFAENFFPVMNARWDDYPDHIGHWNFPGCFRCHAGNHRSDDGRVVTTDCNACHTILAQGFPSEQEERADVGQPFIHPVDFEVMDEPIFCHECHDGALGL